MKPLIDAHTHTVASGHAYSSLQEMAKAAAEKGLQVLGITEHGPSVPGTCPLLYFKNMFVVLRQMYGVRLSMTYLYCTTQFVCLIQCICAFDITLVFDSSDKHFASILNIEEFQAEVVFRQNSIEQLWQ